MTYAELVQKIRDYTEVSSNVLTSTIIDGLIEDAEFRIFRDVDSDNNRRYATSSSLLAKGILDIPDNALVIRSAQITDIDPATSPSTDRGLMEYRDTNFMAEYNPTDSQGTPKYWELLGSEYNRFCSCTRSSLYNSVKLYLERFWIIEYKYYNISKYIFSQWTFVCKPSRGIQFSKGSS
jgi:hypothetical protein